MFGFNLDPIMSLQIGNLAPSTLSESWRAFFSDCRDLLGQRMPNGSARLEDVGFIPFWHPLEIAFCELSQAFILIPVAYATSHTSALTSTEEIWVVQSCSTPLS
jgi:hypothetical protein